jgi:glycogen debranching enzyme
VRFDLQGAWWSDWPDRPDEARYYPETGRVLAWDALNTEWCAAMGADRLPVRCEIGPDLWGPEKTGSLDATKDMGLLRNPSELQGRGISARLEYAIALEAGGSATIDFAIAGGDTGASCANAALDKMLAERESLRVAKRARVASIIESASRIETPRPDLDRTYATQNLCLDMLTLEARGVGQGLVAGLPHFAWFFGCDTYYSVGGLLVAGQGRTALDNLRLLAQYARRQEGRVPHEITQTGELFNPGNTIETGEFVTAVEKAFRWTGDRAFLDEIYELCRACVFGYLLGKRDPDGTLLPDGPGLLELSTAEHGKKLDVACSLYQALGSLRYLAGVMADVDTARLCVGLEEGVRARIEGHFWVAERQEYIWRIEPDLSARPDEPAHSYVALEMGLLDGSQRERIERLFAKVEGPEHTGPRGIIHPGTSDVVMPIQNAIVALAEFRYGRPDRGLWYLERMAETSGRLMPWAIPEYSTDGGCCIQAWSSAAYNWLIVQGLLRLNPDPANEEIVVQPQLPSGWGRFRVENLSIWGRRYDITLARGADGIEIAVNSRDGDNHAPFRIARDPQVPANFV